MTQVLGVDRLYLNDDILEERADQRSWVSLRKSPEATWMAIADSEEVNLTSENEELLTNMLRALKMPEKAINVFVLPLSVERVDALQKEFPRYKSILCLGEHASKLVTEITKENTPHQMFSFFNQNIGCSHSLSQLNKNPGLKSQTWKLMQSLLAQ